MRMAGEDRHSNDLLSPYAPDYWQYAPPDKRHKSARGMAGGKRGKKHHWASA